jgi:methyl-accepting chemotaxis protein
MAQAATNMLGHLEEIAANNLAIEDMEISSQDEIGKAGQALNRMKNNLREVIQSIAGTAEHVATLQAQGAETQKDQTTQVATGMQEMAATVQQVSENSGKAADASRQAAEVARRVEL